MKENKKNRKYIIICLSLWLVFCISLLVSYKEEWTVFINEPHIVYHEGINENGKTKKLNEGDSLIQKFKADYSEMTGIALKMNAESVKKVMAQEGICIAAEDTGGNYARTMLLDLATGDVIVRTVGRPERHL